MGMGELIAAIDEIVAADPQTLGDGDTLVELHRQFARLDAAITRAAGAFDASGEWRVSGARSAGSWLAAQANLPVSVAKGRMRMGRVLRQMPAVEAAWSAGDINGSHARAFAQSHNDSTAEVFERDEAMLVGEAKRLRFASFLRAISYWRMRADADGVERDDEAKRDRRRAHLSQSFEGMWFGDQVFDPASGAIVAGELERLERQLFEADWAEAKERLGREPTVQDLHRTPAQRRADAYVEMAKRSRALPNGARPAEPCITVLVGYETFAGPICQLANGTVVSPGTVAGLMDEAWVERIVFDGPSRVIDVGRRRRIFRGATRRAVEVRDRECFHPLCDADMDHCQVDHVEPFGAGGITVQDNGRLACPKHNRDRHKRRPPPDDP